MIRLSVAFPKQRAVEEQLTALDTTSSKRSLSDTCKRAGGFILAVGGLDLSLNDDTQKGQGIGWQLQFYGFADMASREALSTVLRDTFSPTKTVLRPVQIKDCDGSARAISYAFKTDFVRRIAYRTTVGPPERRRRCWHTRKVSLRPIEHVRAMIWMHRTGFAGRLFLRGVRMTRIGDSVGLVQIKKLE
jgi:hypothetical protein